MNKKIILCSVIIGTMLLAAGIIATTAVPQPFLPCKLDCKYWPDKWYKCGNLCRNVPGGIIDEINIGVPASEMGHNLVGWGPIEPATHGGEWGGGDGGTIRVTWYYKLTPCTDCNFDKPWAEFSFKNVDKTCAKTLEIRALNGFGDDSFTVECNKELIYTYTDPAPKWDDPETWKTHTMTLPGDDMCDTILKCKITATGPAWEYFNPYGQLGISDIKLMG